MTAPAGTEKSVSENPVGERVELGRYRVSTGERILYGQRVDGVVRVERTGSNTAGDLLRLLPWLANEGAARTGGLRKGQWITTGSWTGNTLASSRCPVEVLFSTAGRVDLRFA